MRDIHAFHTCYVCRHPIAWVGNLCGEWTVGHGRDIHATLTVAGDLDEQGYLPIGVQLQCPECGAVNQFKAKHKLEESL
ncbi:hypothetical protein ACOJUR_11840 [Alicyclobacillus tolerans]|uniref:Uncharacterized protein n=2 Tax=Alicyclobacillus tolerans TaxID=90970 RepID=A0ABT9LSP0_9BACL|nr:MULTISPECIES: hypothetical protein [Alicyclobacillus]MDP9727283.1 hypothetical protein [Alicyclobacillus tengchongensis]QRF23036.1 hypothetical protein FY534_04585 [Alicyclobacillus sp. TC]SHJ55160.1 hypothetical protein SAMN05443507_101174 [Alicyclobacillus montanus]